MRGNRMRDYRASVIGATREGMDAAGMYKINVLVTVGTMGTSSLALNAISKMERMTVYLGRGQPFHVAYEVGGKAMHALGNRFFSMRVTTAQASRFINEASTRALVSLPVRNPAAAQMTGQNAWSCVTGACSAFIRGWIR